MSLAIYTGTVIIVLNSPKNKTMKYVHIKILPTARLSTALQGSEPKQKREVLKVQVN